MSRPQSSSPPSKHGTFSTMWWYHPASTDVFRTGPSFPEVHRTSTILVSRPELPTACHKPYHSRCWPLSHPQFQTAPQSPWPFLAYTHMIALVCLCVPISPSPTYPLQLCTPYLA